MSRQSHYVKWRDSTYKILNQRIRIQKLSIVKLQRRIASAVGGINSRNLRFSLIRRHFPKRKWSFTDVSRLVVAAIGLPCPYCQKLIHWNNWSLDHRQPVEKGGINSRLNVQCICRACNRRKGSMDHHAFQYLLKCMKKFPDDYTELLTRLAYGGKFFSHKRGK